MVSKPKMTLKKQTLRVLTVANLEEVNGGAPTYWFCDSVKPNCMDGGQQLAANSGNSNGGNSGGGGNSGFGNSGGNSSMSG